jgi:putative glycosyltransferase
MKLSVVTTLYRSAAYLPAFYERVSREAQRLTDDYELVFVNDGSPDYSLAVALELYRADPRVRVVDLSRNFGHHQAMMAGLATAQGDLVFLLDCDLEEAPELLGQFHATLTDAEADVVYGVQDTRKGGLFERLSGRLFYAVFNWLSETRIPENLTTARLMTRRYVDALLQFGERELVISGLWVLAGFKQVPQVVTKHAKRKSSYTLGRKLDLLVNAVTSFSSRPLILVFYLGWLIMSLSGLGALALIVRVLFFGDFLAGWPSLIVSIWLMGGMIIFCLGILGIYLARVFSESKQRPRVIVRALYDHRTEGIYAPRPATELREHVLYR